MSKFESLNNRTAFITGATGGIGKSIAFGLAEKGCHLFLTDTEQSELTSLCNELADKYNVKVASCAADLRDLDAVHNVVAEANNFNETMDIVINSAGIFPNMELKDSKDKDFQDTFDINFRSAFVFCREFSGNMVKQAWGRMINIGSSSSYNGFRGTSLYCASKHAILGFSRSIHDELKQYNVRTYCISPSSTQSKMGMATKGQDYSTFLDPDDVAEYVIFAMSFDSNIMSEEIFLKRMIIR